MGDVKKMEKGKTKSIGGDSKTKASGTKSKSSRPGAGGVQRSSYKDVEHTRRQKDQDEVDRVFEILDKGLRAFPSPSACSGACEDPYKCDHEYGDDDLPDALSDEAVTERKSEKKLQHALENFERAHLSIFRKAGGKHGRGQETLLHVMASKWSSKDAWSPKQKHFLGWMLGHPEFHDMLERENENGYTPMHIALSQKLDEFVNCVLEAPRGTGSSGGAGGIINVLRRDSTSAGNCFHLATKHNFPHLKAMLEMCAANKDVLLVPNQAQKDTPLHIAVKVLELPVPDDPPEKHAPLPQVATPTTRQPGRDGYSDAGQEEEDGEDDKYEKLGISNASDLSQELDDENDSEFHPDNNADDDESSNNPTDDGGSDDGDSDHGDGDDPETTEPKRYRPETDEEREDRLWATLNELGNETERPRPPASPPSPSSHYAHTERGANALASTAAAATSPASTDLPPTHSVRLIIEANPDALEMANAKERTPYREREEALLTDGLTKRTIARYVDYAMENDSGSKWGDSDAGSCSDDRASSAAMHGNPRQEQRARDLEARAQRMLVVRDPVAHYIRSFCVRESRSREEKMTRLYKPGRECHIEFDLAGMPKTVVPHAYLDQLALHLKFESILKYVALPTLSIEREQQQHPVPSHTNKYVTLLCRGKLIFPSLPP
jgi:hypothetical protein